MVVGDIVVGGFGVVWSMVGGGVVEVVGGASWRVIAMMEVGFIKLECGML